MSTARVSTRISIRWPPAPASEPTDTLVLTLGGFYVDLRIDKASGGIDWALAGERKVLSQDPLKVEFTHPLDSHCTSSEQIEEAEEAPDVGDFRKLENGDDLETGVMKAPHLGGEMRAYEEVWRELEVEDVEVEGGAKGWIVEGVDAEGGRERKVWCARVGGWFLGVARREGEGGKYVYDAVREDLVGGRWERRYTVGDVEGLVLVRTTVDKKGGEQWKKGKVLEGDMGIKATFRAVEY